MLRLNPGVRIPQIYNQPGSLLPGGAFRVDGKPMKHYQKRYLIQHFSPLWYILLGTHTPGMDHESAPSPQLYGTGLVSQRDPIQCDPVSSPLASGCSITARDGRLSPRWTVWMVEWGGAASAPLDDKIGQRRHLQTQAYA